MSRQAQPSSFGLRDIGLLAGLSQERLDALARECVWRRYEGGQRIISRDGQDRDVHLLVAGKVRVTTYSAGGRQVTFRDERAGALFGDMAAIDEGPRSADVIALGSVLVASMPPATFRRLLRDEPKVAERIMRRLAGLVRRLSERVIDLSTLGVRNRIHAELLRLAREAGIVRNTARLDPAPRHADLASQVSTYREQVTRELSALARSGLLKKQGGALMVCDVQRLEKLVQEVRSEG